MCFKCVFGEHPGNLHFEKMVQRRQRLYNGEVWSVSYMLYLLWHNLTLSQVSLIQIYLLYIISSFFCYMKCENHVLIMSLASGVFQTSHAAQIWSKERFSRQSSGGYLSLYCWKRITPNVQRLDFSIMWPEHLK